LGIIHLGGMGRHYVVDFRLMNLTIAYMLTENDREDWLGEMLSDLSILPYPVVQYPGIVGDFSKARYDLFSSIKSEYVLVVDPDDRVIPEVIVECLEFLDLNPEYAACSGHETCIGVDGKIRSTYPIAEFDFGRLLLTPLEFHGGVIFRTAVVKEFLDTLFAANFYNFDWALKLSIASKYPVKKLKRIGYKFRRKPKSHFTTFFIRDGQVPPKKTVNKLIELGLVDEAVFNANRYPIR
jgi:hypothetical protein